jgi:hypothetical protein
MLMIKIYLLILTHRNKLRLSFYIVSPNLTFKWFSDRKYTFHVCLHISKYKYISSPSGFWLYEVDFKEHLDLFDTWDAYLKNLAIIPKTISVFISHFRMFGFAQPPIFSLTRSAKHIQSIDSFKTLNIVCWFIFRYLVLIYRNIM